VPCLELDVVHRDVEGGAAVHRVVDRKLGASRACRQMMSSGPVSMRRGVLPLGRCSERSDSSRPYGEMSVSQREEGASCGRDARLVPGERRVASKAGPGYRHYGDVCVVDGRVGGDSDAESFGDELDE
jgi:hypothetical protein